MTRRLLIVGGSVSAAAMSAVRAGFEVHAVDRFADRDLRANCLAFQRYEELKQIVDFARQMPSSDWVYTGPLENYPQIIQQLERHRNLLGMSGGDLRDIRDPWCLAAAFRQAKLPCPKLSDSGKKPVGRNWLSKPLCAAGGFGIVRLDKLSALNAADSGSVYFQEFIAGRACGATFVGANGRAVLIGVTEQLLGTPWGGSREFQYAGSIGPITLSPEQMQALVCIGNCVAERFSVQGLFGVDVIANSKDVWPIEVNPRYTASVEVLERALQVPAISWHVAACRHAELPQYDFDRSRSDDVELHGKVIVYARRAFVVDEDPATVLGTGNADAFNPTIADIPVAGTRINVGDPIVTVFAHGDTIDVVQERLRRLIDDVQQPAAMD